MRHLGRWATAELAKRLVDVNGANGPVMVAQTTSICATKELWAVRLLAAANRSGRARITAARGCTAGYTSTIFDQYG